MRQIAFALVPVLLLVAVLPGAPSVHAQEDGSLHGIVCSEPGHGAADERGCHQGLPGVGLRLQRAGLIGPVGEVDERTTSDDHGAFMFDGLEDGTYTLQAERAGFETVERDVEVSGKTWLDIGMEGKQVQVDGVVQDPDAKPVGDASVVLYSRYDDVRVEVREDGTFTTTVRAGHHGIEARAPGFNGLHEQRLLDGNGTLELVMKPVPPQTSRIVGTVTDQDGAPVAGAHVQVHQYGGHGEVRPMAEPADGMDDPANGMSPAVWYPGGSNHTTTANDGSYVIHVDAGDASVQISKDGHTTFDEHLHVDQDDEVRQDAVLHRFPEKTARIEGRAVDPDTGDPVRHIHVSVESPRYGIHECSSSGSSDAASGTSRGSAGSADAVSEPARSMPHPEAEHRCAVTVHDDGTFTGSVTPGHSIITVHFDHWRTCSETRDADGSGQRRCGQDRYPFVQTLHLEADTTTPIEATLQARPGTDATVSGYVLGEDDQGLEGAHVQFSHMDSHAYGSAVADEHGSYKIQLRSGMHRVDVWADGHLSWSGMLDVPAGEETSLDVRMEPGQEAYGRCCMAYPVKGMAEDRATSGADAPMEDVAGDDGRASGGSTEASEGYEDLGGGLGPYNAKERQALVESGEEAPGPAMLLLLAVLAGAAVAAWRRQA